MSVRGGWPYVNSISTNTNKTIFGINIAGGSLCGLESTTGIIAETLKKINIKETLMG